MAKFRSKPTVIEAEQFHLHADPESWPEGVRWGGDLPSGTGCYVVRTAHGNDAPLADGDWVVAEPDGRGHYPVKPDIFAARYEPIPPDGVSDDGRAWVLPGDDTGPPMLIVSAPEVLIDALVPVGVAYPDAP